MASQKIIVIGAGAFGVWTAYQLLEKGIQVQLIDAWGPGHSRASSGGETRVIRSVYGSDGIYVGLAAEAIKLWEQYDQEWQTKHFVKTGNLWLISGDDDAYLQSALPHLKAHQLPIEELPLATARQQYPQINFEDIRKVYLETEAGLLYARQACQEVCKRFIAKGGQYQQAEVHLGEIKNGQLKSISLSDQSQLQADQYVFACGPWLPKIFPNLLQQHLTLSRQEVYYFATPPAATTSFQSAALPVWIDLGESVYYGIPNSQHRGFKLADDSRRESIDPDTTDRVPRIENIERSRAYLSHRFPSLGQAALIESRVCQYTNTADGHFIIDRHPEADNLWIAGAGCGHAFKMGPAIGKYISNIVVGQEAILPFFKLDRLNRLQTKSSQFQGHQS